MNKQNASKARSTLRTALKVFYLLPVLIVLGLLAYLISHLGKPLVSVEIKALTAKLSTQDGQLHPGRNELFIQFRNGQNKLADVGQVTFELDLRKPDMVMHSIGKVLPTGSAGRYRTTVDPQTPGDWTATIGYSGPLGNAQTNFTIAVK